MKVDSYYQLHQTDLTTAAFLDQVLYTTTVYLMEHDSTTVGYMFIDLLTKDSNRGNFSIASIGSVHVTSMQDRIMTQRFS